MGFFILFWAFFVEEKIPERTKSWTLSGIPGVLSIFRQKKNVLGKNRCQYAGLSSAKFVG